MRFASVVPSSFIHTPITASAPDVLRSGSIGETNLGPAGRPEDVAGAVEFLLSITGSEITVDGDAALHSGPRSISDALRAIEGTFA
jgi:NAD(P)-dependent dehydrogenase (short-subunit alcohol dehydrogenase family)